MRLPAIFITLGGVVAPLVAIAQVEGRGDFPAAAAAYRPSDLEGDPETWLAFETDDAAEAQRFAMALGDRAGTADNDLARRLRRKARQMAQHALDLGAEHPLLQLMIATTDEQGNQPMVRLDADEQIDALLQQGEAAFGQQDFGAALRAYEAVLALDPDHYKATLFVGDVHFARRDFDHAIRYFARAVEIDPDTAVAHRYWGDALLHSNQIDAAREHYVEALVASPYDSFCRQSMVNWARAANAPLRSSDAWFPTSTISWEPDTEGPQMVLSAEQPGDMLSLVFATGRVHWLTIEHPVPPPTTDQPYRQSLAETASALRLVIRSATELREAMAAPDAPKEGFLADVTQLAQLDQAGLLEAHILLDRANNDLAQDYPAYRATHRDAIRRYINDVWLRPLTSAAAE